VFAGLTRALLGDLGAELAGAVVAVGGDGSWQRIDPLPDNAAY
jgi:hypothetical protein